MKILCAGDYIEDSYVFGTASRLCPEAPVPVVVPETTRTSAGGVGLVANQLRELGADVEEWRGSFSRKQRIFAGNHLITRIDTDSIECFPDDFPDISKFDAIVVSDYSKGAMSDELASKLRYSLLPLFIDAKHRWGWYYGNHTTIFPNQIEAENDAYNSKAFKLVVRKRGEHGACLDYPNGLGVDATAKDVVDVTGAGDIFMAGFVYAWSLPCSLENCLRFANEIAGESCRHLGTYVVPREFAQSVLERLQVSGGFGQKVHGYALDSNWSSIPPPNVQDHIEQIAAETLSRNPDVDYVEVRGATTDGRYSHVLAQIRPKLPLVPKPVSDVPTPERIDTEPGSKPPWEG